MVLEDRQYTVREVADILHVDKSTLTKRCHKLGIDYAKERILPSVYRFTLSLAQIKQIIESLGSLPACRDRTCYFRCLGHCTILTQSLHRLLKPCPFRKEERKEK